MIAVLLVLFSSLANGQVGHYVGNGGDGCRVNGRLVLTDLWEAGPGVALASAAPSERLSLQVAALSLPVEVDRVVLAQQLEALESLRSGLGEYLLSAMRSYTWIMVDSPLGLLEDRDGRSLFCGERVQLASRLGRDIRIHRASFLELSSRDQIGLILHEALFSMLTPEVDSAASGGRLRRQSARKAREIVGEFFRVPASVERLSSLVESYTGMRSWGVRLRDAAVYRVEASVGGGASAWSTYFLAFRGTEPGALEAFCPDGPAALYGRMESPAAEVSLELYQSEFGEQWAVKPLPFRVYGYPFVMFGRDRRDCAGKVGARLLNP